MELLRTLVMLGAMSAFLGICWWAYAPSRKEHWQRKALLLDDEETGTDHVLLQAQDRKRGLSLISGLRHE